MSAEKELRRLQQQLQDYQQENQNLQHEVKKWSNSSEMGINHRMKFS